MTNDELNTALYEKMFAEQETYRAWLLSQPSEEILNHTYEYTVREDILLSMEYNCYLLGIFPKNAPKRNKRLHFLLREDLAKMDAISEEVKLLVGNHIDTAEQLSSYKERLESRIELLTADRKSLYRKQRTVSVKSDEDALTKVKAQIADISKELAAFRREVRLCEDIAIRSGVIREKTKAVRKDEQSQGKENKRDEQFRRRSGADRQA